MKVIMGRLNYGETIKYWKLNEWVFDPNKKCEDLIGSYAVVENCNDIDLVKIIAVIDTIEEYEKNLIGKKISKEAICLFEKGFFEKNRISSNE